MKKFVAFLVLALAALALVACGDGGNDDSTATTAAGGGSGAEKSPGGGSGPTSTLKLEADPNGALAFTTTKATVKAGKVTIEFHNPQSIDHNVAVENAQGEEAARVEAIVDGSETSTAKLKPGIYHYYCGIPGHREAGMEGTLTVK